MLNALIERITALIAAPFRPRLTNVLDLVNAARDSLCLPQLNDLPHGDRGRSTSCPLANALGGIVGVDGICFDSRYAAQHVAAAWQTSMRERDASRFIVTLPGTLRSFVRDFDLGAYARRL